MKKKKKKNNKFASNIFGALFTNLWFTYQTSWIFCPFPYIHVETRIFRTNAYAHNIFLLVCLPACLPTLNSKSCNLSTNSPKEHAFIRLKFVGFCGLYRVDFTGDTNFLPSVRLIFFSFILPR